MDRELSAMRRIKHKAFTIIELLVVLVLIGIFSAIVYPNVSSWIIDREVKKEVYDVVNLINERKSEVMNVIGEVKGKTCIIIDDMVDSGGTICNAAAALIGKGAKEVYAYVVHAVLSGDAVKKIQKSKIKQFVVTNSIDNQVKVKGSKIKIVSVASLLGEAINRISESRSVSKLFK